MFDINDKENLSTQGFVDQIEGLILKGLNATDLEFMINKIFDYIKGEYNQGLKELRKALNYENIISRIETICKKYDSITEKANSVISEFDVIVKDFFQNKLELQVISTLKDSIAKHDNVFSKVKTNFDKYMYKLPTFSKEIDGFNKECEEVEKIILEEVNKNTVNMDSIKSNLDELNSKFMGLYTYYNYDMLGSKDQEIHEKDKVPEGSLLGIYIVIMEKIPNAIEDINKCLNGVLQDGVYMSIVDASKVSSGETTTPLPSQEPNALIVFNNKGDKEVTDKVASLLFDNTQNNEVIVNSTTI